MAPTRATLAELMAQARAHADLTGSGFVSDAELTAFINAAYFALGSLVSSACKKHRGKNATIALSSGITSYPLPDDFDRLLKVFYADNGRYTELGTFDLGDLEGSSTTAKGGALRYTLLGFTIQLDAAPQSAGTLTMFYIPTITPFVSTTTTTQLESWVAQGWERWIVLGAAADCKVKGEEDPSAIAALQSTEWAVIKAALDPDQGATNHIRMTENYRRR
jgi:hypothetical protein